MTSVCGDAVLVTLVVKVGSTIVTWSAASRVVGAPVNGWAPTRTVLSTAPGEPARLYVRVPVTQSVGVLPRTLLRMVRSRCMVRPPGWVLALTLATPLPTAGADGSAVEEIRAARF